MKADFFLPFLLTRIQKISTFTYHLLQYDWTHYYQMTTLSYQKTRHSQFLRPYVFFWCLHLTLVLILLFQPPPPPLFYVLLHLALNTHNRFPCSPRDWRIKPHLCCGIKAAVSRTRQTEPLCCQTPAGKGVKCTIKKLTWSSARAVCRVFHCAAHLRKDFHRNKLSVSSIKRLNNN